MDTTAAQDLVARLMAQVAAQPDRAAVVEEGRVVTYEAFGAAVRRIAGAIAAEAAGPAPRVAIMLPKSHQAYAAMFGSLMAGGVYTPVDVLAPVERQLRILAGFDPDIVLVPAERVADVQKAAPRARVIDVARQGPPLGQALPCGELAYVIFTSGSTGTPKGVMIPRSALAHYIDWAVPALGITPRDVVSQHPNIAFDLSVVEIYAALCGGACLVPLYSAKDKLLPADAVRRHGITVWVSVPSVIDLMRRAGHVDADHLGSVRLMFFCGEPLLPSHLDPLFEAVPAVRVINAYGPTEATVSCTARLLTADGYRKACRSSVAFGAPIPGMSLELADGEIVLSGPQLARGYWNDPERTAMAFRTETEGGVRRYHTGDQAEEIEGEWFFRNRIDRQVKIRGHRVELGEIDAALRESGALAAYTVLNEASGNELVSYVELPSGAAAPPMMPFLRRCLPDYAIPARIVVVNALPRTLNDKIDHNALKDLMTRHD